MPRTARKLIGSAYMHNMVQGIKKEYIFKSVSQKDKYISLLKKYGQKYNIAIIAYCIMDNHAHILTYSENINNISLFMKETNTEYAIYYNKSNNRVGYVFRNRFNSKIIYNQEYLLKCIKYIHMNPVKAGITEKEEEYKFSSSPYYTNKKNENSEILNLVFKSKGNFIQEYNNIKYEPLNLEKEKVNLSSILDRFLENEKIELSQLQNEKIYIKKFLSYLISNEYEFTKKDLAKIIHISRSKLYRMI